MSGIVGIWNRGGVPADRDLLGEMTRFLAPRGPDGEQVWAEGAAGLGHALLKTTPESPSERQPCTLDGEAWIAADARVDGRAELIGKLEAAGRQGAREADDAQLILHAWHAWGEECPRHLTGDFAFLIYDKRWRRLFGARDPLGVKPFYYAEAGRSVLCSNSLRCLRLHPDVSDELNDLAIADFLLFDWNQDPATTYFAGIRRLPPGHTLMCTEDAPLRIERYWTFPFTEVRYRHGREYIEHFAELFGQAVRDRIRTDRVVVWMSGGMDSTLVAAYANRSLGRATKDSGVRAQTVVFDRLIPDQERKYSQLAADFMGIPIHHLAADDYLPYDGDWRQQFSRPEPEHGPLTGLMSAQHRQTAAYARVALTGYGADPGLRVRDGYIREYLKPGAWGELAAGVGWCVRLSRRIPRLGLRSLLRQRAGKEKAPFRPRHPGWLNPDFEKRLELGSRWERIDQRAEASEHSRGEVARMVMAASWPMMFESLDPGATGSTVEFRHPFMDVRLLKFLAGLPALPWCQEKNILKAGGRGLLPDTVRLRPKTPLEGDVLGAHLRGRGPEWWADHLKPVAELGRFVNLEALPGKMAANGHEILTDLRPVSLNYWLQLGRKSCKILERQGLV